MNIILRESKILVIKEKTELVLNIFINTPSIINLIKTVEY